MNYKSLIAAALTVATLIALPVAAQEWPAKPINMITGSNPGGNSDLFGRIFGEAFHQQTGQPWIMNNRPGANTTVAIIRLLDVIPRLPAHALATVLSRN